MHDHKIDGDCVLPVGVANQGALKHEGDEKNKADHAQENVSFPPVSLPVTGPPFYFDLTTLAEQDSCLLPFIRGSPPSYSFRLPGATAAATTAILRHHFNIALYLPPHYLVPTVPSRLQYLQWALSLLKLDGEGDSTTAYYKGKKRHYIYDIGTGSSCIFPLLAARILPQNFHIFATEVSTDSITAARRNIDANLLSDRIALFQPQSVTSNLLPVPLTTIPPLVVVCNPPFYENETAIGSRFARRRKHRQQKGSGVETLRKIEKASARGRVDAKNHELITPGGEVRFIERILGTSVRLREVHNTWWTSLIGKKKDIAAIKKCFNEVDKLIRDVRFERVHWEGNTARWAVAWRVKEKIDDDTADPT